MKSVIADKLHLDPGEYAWFLFWFGNCIGKTDLTFHSFCDIPIFDELKKRKIPLYPCI